jgi:hypothetical protein
MKYTYTEIKNESGETVAIMRNEDKASIPLDPTNSDYQAYLKRDEAEVK